MAESIELPSRLGILPFRNKVLLPGAIIRIRCTSPTRFSSYPPFVFLFDFLFLFGFTVFALLIAFFFFLRHFVYYNRFDSLVSEFAFVL